MQVDPEPEQAPPQLIKSIKGSADWVRVIDFTDGDVEYEFEHVPVNMPPVSAQLIV